MQPSRPDREARPPKSDRMKVGTPQVAPTSRLSQSIILR